MWCCDDDETSTAFSAASCRAVLVSGLVWRCCDDERRSVPGFFDDKQWIDPGFSDDRMSVPGFDDDRMDE